MSMCEKEQLKLGPFYKGEIHKVYFTFEHDDCNCCSEVDDEFQDFVLKNPTAYLLKNGERIEIEEQELDLTEKMLIITVDCTNLEGFYKLVTECDINDVHKIGVADMRVRSV